MSNGPQDVAAQASGEFAEHTSGPKPFRSRRKGQKSLIDACQGAFPDHKDPDSFSLQCFQITFIPNDILGKFLFPFFSIFVRIGGFPASAMSVPKATVYKYRRVVLAKPKIRAPRDVLFVQAESEPNPVQIASDKYLRFGIASLDAAHPSASGLLVNNIDHKLVHS